MVYTTHKNGDEWGMVYYCYTTVTVEHMEHKGNIVEIMGTLGKIWGNICQRPRLSNRLIGGTWHI